MTEAGGATPFSPHFTPHFAERLEQARLHDRGGHDRILAVISRLLEHPEDADGSLHGEARGLRKKYVGRGEYRIAYSWCRACRKANLHREMNCPHCGTIPENSVVFHELYRKNEPLPW